MKQDTAGSNSRYRIIIDDKTFDDIRSIEGLNVEAEVRTIPDGGSFSGNKTTRGQLNLSGAIVLSYDAVSSSSDFFWQWMQDVLNNESPLPKKNIKIELLNKNNKSAYLTYQVLRGWPHIWQGPQLNQLNSDQNAIEAVSISFETIERLR